MYIYLSKIIPPLFMPLGIGLLFLLAFFVCQKLGLRRAASSAVAVAFLILWTASTPLVANSLISALEDDFPVQTMENLGEGLCAVVLGGAIASHRGKAELIELGEAADRMYVALTLYKNGNISDIVVSGGNQPWSSSDVAEADLVRELLMQSGVPAERIHVDAQSRNTYENAQNSRTIIENLGCEKALLITSAAHMRRAISSFKVAGMKTQAFPVDFRTEPVARTGILDFIPNAGALQQTSDALREWMGQKVYEWKGWN